MIEEMLISFGTFCMGGGAALIAYAIMFVHGSKNPQRNAMIVVGFPLAVIGVLITIIARSV